jgi:hypothetical protein
LDYLTLEDEDTTSFKLPGTTHPTTQCYIPEDPSPQEYGHNKIAITEVLFV